MMNVCFLLIFSILMSNNLENLNIPDKHHLDKTKIKYLTLPNDLEIVIISNPDFNKSAASLCVKVGSLSDPKEYPGLAHFLEHMLFLGTNKYPSVDDYSSYLSTNGGYSNAYTSRDHTNYHFEIIPNAFEGALDRFSRFFYEPLFSEEYTEREINAVNSEFQKNLENDNWRTYQAVSNLYNPNHPANHFNIGSSETLKTINRQVLLDFHKKYYSSNQMYLAILGNQEIEVLESWCKKYFSSIENHQIKKINYPTDYLPKVNKFRLLTINPIKDQIKLELEFPVLENLYTTYGTKPNRILSAVIGHEGEGSLLSLLKSEGLATSLSAYCGPETKDYGSFSISMDLTDRGLSEYKKIIQYLFSYIEMLKSNADMQYFFEEKKILAALSYVYSDKGEGASSAIEYANNLSNYPIQISGKVKYYYDEYNHESINKILSYLVPDNMLCILTAKGLEYNQTEPWYGTKFSYEESNSDYYENLFSPKAVDELFLPPKNNFVPKDVSMLKSDSKSLPSEIYNKNGISLFYAQDNEFERPNAYMKIKIRLNEALSKVKHAAMIDLYLLCVKESLNEKLYNALEADMEYDITYDIEGIIIEIKGYNYSANLLLEEISKSLKIVDIEKNIFANIKDKLMRKWDSFKFAPAWQVARNYSASISNNYFFNDKDKLDAITQVTLNDILSFSKYWLYNSSRIEALIYGNISKTKAINSLLNLKTRLGIRDLDKNQDIDKQKLKVNNGEQLLYLNKTNTNNSCMWKTYQVGDGSVQSRALALILGNIIKTPFYTDMRTKQQLGYLVWGGGYGIKSYSGLYFIIQSGDYSPDYLDVQSEQFINSLPVLIDNIPIEVFDQIKTATIENIKEKPTNIYEKGSKFYSLIFDYKQDFNRDSKTINFINQLEGDILYDFVSKIFDKKETRKITTLIFSNDHEYNDLLEPSIKNINLWKKDRIYN